MGEESSFKELTRPPTDASTSFNRLLPSSLPCCFSTNASLPAHHCRSCSCWVLIRCRMRCVAAWLGISDFITWRRAGGHVVMIDEDTEEGGGGGAAAGFDCDGGVETRGWGVGATGAGGGMMVVVGTKLDGSYSSSSSSSSPSSRVGAGGGGAGVGGG